MHAQFLKWWRIGHSQPQSPIFAASASIKRHAQKRRALKWSIPHSWKVATLFTWDRGEGWVRTVKEVQIIDMLISILLMIIISSSLTVPTQPSPWFHLEAWLPFRNREMDYSTVLLSVLLVIYTSLTVFTQERQINLYPRENGADTITNRKAIVLELKIRQLFDPNSCLCCFHSPFGDDMPGICLNWRDDSQSRTAPCMHTTPISRES